MAGARPAFTMVEFVIAVSVAVALLAAGIPRYNSFLHRQDYREGLQQISACFQTAYQKAVASTDQRVRYTEARVAQNGPNSYRCQVYRWTTNFQALDSAPTEFISENITVNTFRIDTNPTVPYANNLRVFFGSIENGVALQLEHNGGIILSPPTLPFGRGFNLQINTTSPKLSGVASMLTVPRLGSPITIANE